MAEKIYYKTDIHRVVEQLIKEHLDKLEISYQAVRSGEIVMAKRLPQPVRVDLQTALDKYGIELLRDRDDLLVQQIKDAIVEMVSQQDAPITTTTSTYLEETLNRSYSSISKIFKERMYSSIENFVILQKVERAKELIAAGQHTLTEIAYLLNYSSVAHLSNQFKKTTGLSASAFLRIIRRREI